MKEIVIVCALLIFLLGCKQDKIQQLPTLTKVSEEQLIRDTKNHKFPDLEKVVFKTIEGETIPKGSLPKIMRDESMVPDYYQNSEGIIMEAVIRRSTARDKELGKKLHAAFNEGPDVNIREVNCNNKSQILNDIFEKDQSMRRDGGNIDPKVDHDNLEIIVSFIEKCGIPTRDEVSEIEMAAIWAVLQHAPARYQSKYIPNLEEAAERGDLDWGKIALMKDRALMHEGEPQVYGSQVRGDQLYDLFEPEYVNQRRREIGMEPLEDYLKRFDIEFTIEQKTK